MGKRALNFNLKGVIIIFNYSGLIIAEYSLWYSLLLDLKEKLTKNK